VPLRLQQSLGSQYRTPYEKKDQRLGYAKLCALLPNWKTEHEFLSDVPAQALQQALKNLERAYTNFFQKRADFPKFKKKGQHESFRIPQGFEVDSQNGRIKLPKLGWMRYRKSQDVLGEAKNVTVSESCGKWFVSIQTEREVETPQHPSISAVGMDWGVVNFATLSVFCRWSTQPSSFRSQSNHWVYPGSTPSW
jgi:putative transposase